MEEKAIEITWNGSPAQVVVKKLSFGEQQDYDDEIYGEVEIIGKEAHIKFKSGRMKILGVLRSIKAAPFTVTEANVRQLSTEDAARIYEVADELNDFSKKKLQTSSTPSTEGDEPKSGQ